MAVPLGLYQIEHTVSAASGNNLAASIKQFGSNGDVGGAQSLEGQAFTYTATGDVPSVLKESNPFMRISPMTEACDSFLDGTSECLWQSHIGDIDGDGRADLVRVHAGSQGWCIQYTCGGDDGLSGPIVTHTNKNAFESNYMRAVSTLADINGDGKLDLVLAVPDKFNHALALYYGYGAPSCSLGQLYTSVETLAYGTAMSADGYRLQETTFSDRNTSYVIDYSFDGLGEVRKIVDNSGLGVIMTTRSKTVVDFRVVSRESLPYFAGGAARYLETRLDLKGRPENLRRCDSDVRARQAAQELHLQYRQQRVGDRRSWSSHAHLQECAWPGHACYRFGRRQHLHVFTTSRSIPSRWSCRAHKPATSSITLTTAGRACAPRTRAHRATRSSPMTKPRKVTASVG